MSKFIALAIVTVSVSYLWVLTQKNPWVADALLRDACLDYQGIARKLARRETLIPYTENGFKEQTLWEGFVNTVLHHAVQVEELCPESYDSSLAITFKDGSKFELVNPAQACYQGYVRLN